MSAEDTLRTGAEQAEVEIEKRLLKIQEELAKVVGGRHDGCVAVSKGEESILAPKMIVNHYHRRQSLDSATQRSDFGELR